MENPNPKKTLGNPTEFPWITDESREAMKQSGFPSPEEQMAYWNKKEVREQVLLQALDAFSDFLTDLQSTMAKLRGKLEKVELKEKHSDAPDLPAVE